MRLYLAGAYVARDVIREHVVPQIPARHPIHTSWIHADHAITPETVGAALGQDDAYIASHTAEDFQEVDNADAVLLLTESWMRTRLPGMGYVDKGLFTTGGRHVETGYALARGKLVLTVGTPENVFHRSNTIIVPTLAEAVVYLDIVEALKSNGLLSSTSSITPEPREH